MRSILSRLGVAVVLLSSLTACASVQESNDDIIVTLIFTNDMESAYAPVPAWWRDDMDHIGGIAELTTLIKNIRRDEPNVFLFGCSSS